MVLSPSAISGRERNGRAEAMFDRKETAARAFGYFERSRRRERSRQAIGGRASEAMTAGDTFAESLPPPHASSQLKSFIASASDFAKNLMWIALGYGFLLSPVRIAATAIPSPALQFRSSASSRRLRKFPQTAALWYSGSSHRAVAASCSPSTSARSPISPASAAG